MENLQPLFSKIKGKEVSIESSILIELLKEYQNDMCMAFDILLRFSGQITMDVNYLRLGKAFSYDMHPSDKYLFKVNDFGVFFSPFRLPAKTPLLRILFVPNDTETEAEHEKRLSSFDHSFGDMPYLLYSNEEYSLVERLPVEVYSSNAAEFLNQEFDKLSQSYAQYLYCFFPTSSTELSNYQNPNVKPVERYSLANAEMILPDDNELKTRGLDSRLAYLYAMSDNSSFAHFMEKKAGYYVPRVEEFVGKKTVKGEFFLDVEGYKLPMFPSLKMELIRGNPKESIEDFVIYAEGEDTFDPDSKNYCIYTITSKSPITKDAFIDFLRYTPVICTSVASMPTNMNRNIFYVIGQLENENLLEKMIDVFEKIYMELGIDIYEPDPLFTIDASENPSGLALAIMEQAK